jgi:radical SAM superfamily enzyme YgiQ (UPF0313 family)
MRLMMTEASDSKDAGSMGAHYVAQAAMRSGHHLVADGQCDIEMVSVHHCEDFTRLAAMPRRGRLRLAGGHVMANNCRPAIPFADAICIGEGETWIGEALRRLSADFRAQALRGMPGALVCSDWPCDLPAPAWETSVPRNEPYLNKTATGHAATWYIEMARGCPFACHYCELGHTVPYRIQDTAWLCDQLRNLPRGAHVSLFAPDEASHPGYAECLRTIANCGLVTMFGSVRADQVAKRDLPFPRNMLLRVGLDGLTQETRARVDKRITDQDIVDYFTLMSQRGHSNFKAFLVVGYPWERRADVDAWDALWERIRRIPRDANAHVRIKVTPLIPQPSTPLAHAAARYDMLVHDALRQWFRRVAKPFRADRPGWFIVQDGAIMSRRRWQQQCRLTKGGIEACSAH